MNVEKIVAALREYKCVQWTVNHGNGIEAALLVDILTPSNAPDIRAGIVEIESIAEYLADELDQSDEITRLNAKVSELENLNQLLRLQVGEPTPRYSCFVKGCPGDHPSKYMMCRG